MGLRPNKPNKIHLSGDGPPPTLSPQGVALVETFCNRFCPQSIVAPVSRYRSWVRSGLTASIYCDRCRREVSVEEGVASTA